MITEHVFLVEIRTYNCLHEVLSRVVTSEFTCEDLE